MVITLKNKCLVPQARLNGLLTHARVMYARAGAGALFYYFFHFTVFKIFARESGLAGVWSE